MHRPPRVAPSTPPATMMTPLEIASRDMQCVGRNLTVGALLFFVRNAIRTYLSTMSRLSVLHTAAGGFWIRFHWSHNCRGDITQARGTVTLGLPTGCHSPGRGLVGLRIVIHVRCAWLTAHRVHNACASRLFPFTKVAKSPH